MTATGRIAAGAAVLALAGTLALVYSGVEDEVAPMFQVREETATPTSAVARRSLLEPATCTGTDDSDLCSASFDANKGDGHGFHEDCVGPPGSPTADCIYTPGTVLDQCGMFAHTRPGAGPQAQCEAVVGCEYSGGTCVRGAGPIAGMCDGNSDSSEDVVCPDSYVLKDGAEGMQRPSTDADEVSVCCQLNAEAVFGTLDGNQDRLLTTTEFESDWALSQLPAT